MYLCRLVVRDDAGEWMHDVDDESMDGVNSLIQGSRVSCKGMCMSGCAAEFTPGSWSLSPGRNKVFEDGFWGPGLAF